MQGVKEAVNWMQRIIRTQALQLLGAKWFKDTAPMLSRSSFDRLLPAISRTGIFTKEGLEKQRAYKSVGEDVDVNLNRRRALDQRQFLTNSLVQSTSSLRSTSTFSPTDLYTR